MRSHVPDARVADQLATNVRALRASREQTQEQMAKLSGIPRATRANIDSGAANPTLSVLNRVALALQVSVEELISTPRSTTSYHPAESLRSRRQGPVTVRKLLPEPIPGIELERMELPAGSRFVGTPHTAGTREFLTCERGELHLAVAGERWTLHPGDVVSFHGDQRHSYAADVATVGYSVVLFASGR
jgi:transcriptional regulator with XRE-family HTH domain